MEHISWQDYNYLLVILSILTSIIASYEAFDILARVKEGSAKKRVVWLCISSLFLGVGIWSLHYIGMLSINFHSRMEYRLFHVLTALILINLVTLLALFLLVNRKQSIYGLVVSSFVNAAGISSMHFIGMTSMNIDYQISYSPVGLLVSFLVAYVFSYFSFKEFADHGHFEDDSTISKIKSGIWMGLAISGLHYIAMSSATMRHLHTGHDYLYPLINTTLLGIGIAVTIIVFVIIISIISSLDRKVSKQTEKLQMNEQYYKALFNQNPDTILTFDLDGRFLTANYSFTATFGYAIEELKYKTFTPLLAPKDVNKTHEYFLAATKGKMSNFECTIFDKNGDEREVNITKIPLYLNGKIIGIYDIVKDITQHKKVEKDLAETDIKYKSLVENSIVGVYIIQDERLVYANPRLCEIFGYTQNELLSIELRDIISPEDFSKVIELVRKRAQKGNYVTYQYRGIKKDKSVITLEVYGSSIDIDDKKAVIGTIIDITERQKYENTIRHMAYHDHLTGIPNRILFFEKLTARIEQRKSNDDLAVLFIDLDRFKLINDSLGHEAGDKLLIEIVRKIQSCLGEEDILARYGGDEFVVLISQMGHHKAIEVAKRIIKVCSRPIQIEHYDALVTTSIGIATISENAETPDILIKHADLAMYTAKKQGANQYRVFTADLIEKTKNEEQLEVDLRTALMRDEFFLHYQPQINLETNRTIGLEALIRWNHPKQGLVSPARFIPIAEETGLIIPLGEWVLHQACLQMKQLQDEGLPPVPVSVNISPKQFFQSNLVELVQSILNQTGLEAKFLELEITESITMNVDCAIATLQQLRDLGIKVSIDDFGTGYSSLNYLSKLPIDKVKIDQSFIRHMSDTNDETIVKAIISMGRNLNLGVIAEGVETIEHVKFLKQQGCNQAQGYLFSKPIPLKELRDYLSHI